MHYYIFEIELHNYPRCFLHYSAHQLRVPVLLLGQTIHFGKFLAARHTTLDFSLRLLTFQNVQDADTFCQNLNVNGFPMQLALFNTMYDLQNVAMAFYAFQTAGQQYWTSASCYPSSPAVSESPDETASSSPADETASSSPTDETASSSPTDETASSSPDPTVPASFSSTDETTPSSSPDPTVPASFSSTYETTPSSSPDPTVPASFSSTYETTPYSSPEPTVPTSTDQSTSSTFYDSTPVTIPSNPESGAFFWNSMYGPYSVGLDLMCLNTFNTNCSPGDRLVGSLTCLQREVMLSTISSMGNTYYPLCQQSDYSY